MSAIKAGDLVMVVRPTCCGLTFGIGHTFVAKSVDTSEGCCLHCGRSLDGYGVSDNTLTWASYRLIRIDPPALPQSVETEREVVA